MKKRVQSLWLFGALVVFLSVGLSLSAQQTQPPDSQAQPPTADQPAPTGTQQAPPSQTPEQTPDQATKPAPDSQAEATPASDSQSFTGTIVKSGDKYVFQDAASGNTYDIDHQDEVQKFEGKKVKVHGKLDDSGKMIRLQ